MTLRFIPSLALTILVGILVGWVWAYALLAALYTLQYAALRIMGAGLKKLILQQRPKQ